MTDPGVPTGDQPDPRLIDAIAQAIRVKNPQGAAQTAEVAAYVADGWHWAPGMPHRVPDPGVPTGDQPRTRIGRNSWLGDLSDQEYETLVRSVRDAAQVPALRATAQRWEQARELAATMSKTWCQDTETVHRLLDLLTEAPDGE